MGIPITGLAPLLEVFDLPTSVAFYGDVLGFELVSATPGWCMLKQGKIVLMLNTAYDEGERPAKPDLDRTRWHGDTSLYLDSPDVDAVYAHLRSKGWPATEPVVTSYGLRLITARDPDGFQVCFLSPLPPV